MYFLTLQNKHIVFFSSFKVTTELKDNKLVNYLKFYSYLVKELDLKSEFWLQVKHFSIRDI